MRIPVITLCFVVLVAACNRKTVPSKNKVPPPTTTLPGKPAPPNATVPPASADSPAVINPAIMGSPMIVIDGSGNIVTAKDKLPSDIAAKVHLSGLARSFTPAQKKNLVYRYKMIPPKVLYVPEGYVSKSARGKYIVYRKKFWYWQKADGLFHLDPTYYQ
ncbi:hypothetical protein [Asinibacterium sp. OR53]|uniref:hypothetical protein n=1 Tax=Asinibacterium sp. OR53 TaxID=925409 RepID=UPI00047C0D9D|nr:hypothetical protein [Asinibacterium sp. OR53]